MNFIQDVRSDFQRLDHYKSFLHLLSFSWIVKLTVRLRVVMAPDWLHKQVPGKLPPSVVPPTDDSRCSFGTRVVVFLHTYYVASRVCTCALLGVFVFAGVGNKQYYVLEEK